MHDSLHPAVAAERRQRAYRALSTEDAVMLAAMTPTVAERHMLGARVRVTGAGIERIVGRSPEQGERWWIGRPPGAQRTDVFSSRAA